MANHLRIVIPEYGGRQELTAPLIDSIPHMDTDTRIFIGDDGFYIDDSEHISYGLEIIHFDKNVGFARNVNRLAGLACKDIPDYDLATTVLLIVNTDVIFYPNAVETLVDSVLRYGNMCGPAILVPPGYVDDTGWGPHKQLFSKVRYTTELTKGFAKKLFSDSMTMLSGACFALPASAWFALGGFDCESYRAYYEDDDFGIRMNLAGYDVNVCYDAIIEHTVSQTIMEDDPKNKQIREASLANFKSKWPDYEWGNTGQYFPDKKANSLDARIVFKGEGRSEIL